MQEEGKEREWVLSIDVVVGRQSLTYPVEKGELRLLRISGLPPPDSRPSLRLSSGSTNDHSAQTTSNLHTLTKPFSLL